MNFILKKNLSGFSFSFDEKCIRKKSWPRKLCRVLHWIDCWANNIISFVMRPAPVGTERTASRKKVRN